MTLRDKVMLKYGGLCAYSGKPLEKDWQIDHLIPKKLGMLSSDIINLNHIDNLLPTLRIVNHYKRARSLEEFRILLGTLHIRLNKLQNWA